MTNARAHAFAAVVTLVTATMAGGEEPTDNFGDPLPEGAKVRLGTTRFRNIWSEAPVAVSSDGKTLAVMKEQKDLMFVDAATGKVSRSLQLPNITGGQVEFLPGGKLMAVASFHDRLSVIELETGRSVGEVPAQIFRSRADSVVSANGKRAAFSDSDSFADPEKKVLPVTVWDPPGKKAVVTVTRSRTTTSVSACRQTEGAGHLGSVQPAHQRRGPSRDLQQTCRSSPSRSGRQTPGRSGARSSSDRSGSRG